MLLADSVYQDVRTGKHVIAGTFNQFNVEKLPTTVPPFAVFFALTDAKGTSNLSLEIEHESSGATVIGMRGPFQSRDPLNLVDLCVQFAGIVFHLEGKYWIVLKSGEMIISQRPFFVRLIAASRPENDPR